VFSLRPDCGCAYSEEEEEEEEEKVEALPDLA
jgi:hypothetical protein